MFEGVQQLEPQNPIYDFFEGKYYYERGNLPRATISFEGALEKKSDLIDALYCLGDICEKMKNRDCAISYYRRVIASTDLERGPYKKLAAERLAALGAANVP
jgi:tetratricopeptide (TPR) repeat protein